jgi:hypothetical protein
MNPQTLLIIAGALAVTYIAVHFLYKADTATEGKRRSANKVAGLLRAKGLKLLPEILEDYGVGDYSGVGIKIHKAALILTHDPDAVNKEFEEVFERALAIKLADPKTRQTLLTRINATP